MTLSFVAAIGSDQSASAATVSYNDSIGLASTDWASTLSFPKYNTAIGTLLSVEIILKAHVEGNALYESTNTSPRNIHMELKAQINVTKPDATLLVGALPAVTIDELAAAFDGAIDFAGPSGSTFLGIFADTTEQMIFNDPAVLALFSGVGTVILPVNADGQSSHNGGGNGFFGFTTNASADVEVIYTFEPTVQLPVPEPASAGMLCFGLVGLAAVRRFKNRKRSAA